MRISILSVQAPFVRGGAEHLADALAERNPARLAPTLKFGLQSQCEFDRFRRSGEHQKERITRGLDLFALGKSCPLPADQPAPSGAHPTRPPARR